MSIAINAVIQTIAAMMVPHRERKIMVNQGWYNASISMLLAIMVNPTGIWVTILIALQKLLVLYAKSGSLGTERPTFEIQG